MVVPHSHSVESSTNAFKQMMAKKKAESVIKDDDVVITERTYCGLSQEEFFRRILELHGFLSPGAILGGIMVDLAVKRLPEGIKYQALVETVKCLPDAVQILTPCSLGNERIHIVNTTKFAVTLYDITNGKGVRVFVDSKFVEKFPEMNKWIMRLVDKKEQDIDLLRNEIITEGHHVLAVLPVEVDKKYYEKQPKTDVIMCPLCFEPFDHSKGDKCPTCSGESPFESYG